MKQTAKTQSKNPAETTMIVAVIVAIAIFYGITLAATSGHGHFLSQSYKAGKFDGALAVFGLPTSQTSGVGGCTCPVCCQL